MSGFEVLTLIVGGASAIAVIVQIQIAARSLREDHDRRKRQATIEYFHATLRPVWRQSVTQMAARWGKGPLTEKALSEIDKDSEARRIVIDLLDTLEVMAVAVHTQIYDKETIIRLAGDLIVNMYNRLRVYLVRGQKQNPRRFREFTRLVEECGERDADDDD